MTLTAFPETASSSHRSAHLILLALFVCALGNSAFVPFVSYFIVEQLHLPPWHISVYSLLTSLLILAGNRLAGERVDHGARIFPIVMCASIGLTLASGVMSLFQSYWLLLFVAGPAIAVASTGTSTMYGLGRLYSAHLGMDQISYNARLRMMASLGWMIGPAATYLIAAHLGNVAVFRFVLMLALIGIAICYLSLPRDFRSPGVREIDGARSNGDRPFDNRPLWLAALVCLLFSTAHVLCSSALPLFYTREAHLPLYTPGLSLTLKCAAEVAGIFCSTAIMQRIGRRRGLYLAAAFSLVAFAVLHQTNSMSEMVVGALLEGWYYGLFSGVAVTFMQGFAKGRMGRATSLYMNSLFLGSLLGNAATGLIASVMDFRTAIVGAAGVMAVAIFGLFLTRHADAAADA